MMPVRRAFRNLCLPLTPFMAAPLYAASLTWDADSVTPGVQDGAGTWDLIAQNWTAGAANTNWNNATPDTATFGSGGAGGTITLGTGISHAGLAFGTNYTLTANTLTAVGTPGIAVSGAVTATIGSTLAGSGFTKTGAGTLVLNATAAANTYTGTIAVTEGQLDLQGTIGDGTIRGNITVSSGARLRQVSNNIIENNAGIEVQAGAVYDFNGRAEYMAGPSGAGVITNLTSTDRNNTLMVGSGSNAFSGTIRGNGIWTMGGGAYWKVSGNMPDAGTPWISGGATLELSGNNVFGVTPSSGWYARIGHDANPGGAGTVIVSGGTTTNTGTLWIGHTTNCHGVLTLAGGTWVQRAAVEMARGPANGTINLVTGGVFDVNSNISDPDAGGTARIVFDGGTLRSRGGTDSITINVGPGGGTITNAGATTSYSGPINNSNRLVISGGSDGTTVILNGPVYGNAPSFLGSVQLQAANFWTNDVVISNAAFATEVLSNTNEVIPDATALTFAGGRFTINNPNGSLPRTETVRSISGSTGSIMTIRTGNKLVTGVNDGSGVYAGTFLPHGSVGGDLQIIKNGSGTQQLNGAITCTDSFIVNGGVLQIGADSSIRGATMVNSGGTFRITGGTAFFNTSAGYTIGLSNSTLDIVAVNLNPGKITFYNGGQSIGPGTTFIRYGFESFASAATATLGHANIQLVSDQMGNAPMVFTVADGAAGTDLLVTSRVGRIGGLTKTGAGRMTMVASNNDYSGTTLIAGGNLALEASATISASSNITVSTSAVFDVSAVAPYRMTGSQSLQGFGTITGTIVQSAGSRIYPGGSASAGRLTFANGLSLADGSTNFLDVGTVTSDLIRVEGNFEPSNSTIAVAALSVLTNGLYPIVSYGGTKTTFFNPAVKGSAAGARQALSLDETSTPQVVNLVVAGSNATLTWISAVDTNFNVQTSTNWFNPSIATNDVFYNGDTVVFDDTPGVATNVNLVSNLVASAVSVTSSTNAFVLAGTGKLTGFTSIEKSGTSTLIVTNTGGNDFAGTVRVSDGLFVPGFVNALGATSGVTIVTNTGTIELGGLNFGAEEFVISGTGFGGQGALVNTVAQQINALQKLTLAGDAAVGGTQRWDVRGAGARLELAGRRLTKIGTNFVALVQGTMGDGSIDIAQGTFGFHFGAVATGTGVMAVSPGGILNLGDYGSTLNIQKTVSVSNAVVEATSGATSATLAGPVEWVDGTTNVLSTTNVAFYLNGPQSGSGALILRGGGGGSAVVQLGSTNSTFTGPVTVAGVRLQELIGPAAFGRLAKLTVAPGGQVYVSTVAVYTQALELAGTGWSEAAGTLGALRLQNGANWAGPITLATNASITAYNSSGTVSGVIAGPYELEFRNGTTVPAGTITLSPAAPNTVAAFYINTNITVIAGTTNALAGNGLALNRGTLQLNGNNGDAAYLTGTGTVQNGSTTAAVLAAGSGNIDTTWTGTLNDGGTGTLGLVKTGTGTLTLAGAQLLNGPVIVSNGILRTITPLLGTDVLAVALGGTFDSTGVVARSVQNDGTVRVGSGIGTLLVTGDYVQSASGVLQCGIGGTAAGVSHDQLAVTGAVTVSGTLNVTLVDGFVPNPLDIFLVVAGSSVAGNFDAVTGTPPGPGLGWKTENASTYIVLSITSAPAASGYDLYANAITNGLSGYADDADGDGFANLLEYVTGGNPTNADLNARIGGGRTNGLLALNFLRNTNAIDATLIVEGSFAATNGADWVGIATNIGGLWGGATNVTESGLGSPVNVSVQDTQAAATNRFLRLRVTRP